MKHFRVIAMYDYPEINRSVQIDAEDARQAILRAILDQRLPVTYARDGRGHLQPLYWQPDMGGMTRWPQIDRNNRLLWKSSQHQGQLRFEVEETD